VHTPFSLDFIGSFIVAQSGAALMLTALLLFWRLSILARVTLFCSVWLAALAVLIGPTAASLGFKPGPDVLRHMLAWSAILVTLGAVFALRPWAALVALAADVPLWWATGYFKESDCELAAGHLAWIGLVIGLVVRNLSPRVPRACRAPREEVEGSYLRHDLAFFAVATLLAALVSVYILGKHEGSADESAYTFQAAVFAKGRIYARVPRCENYLELYFVFQSMGRLFSQYTPGWPLFMTPFVWARAVWLAGPFSMGLMVWGTARLGRSAMRGFAIDDGPRSRSLIRAAGTWAALLSMLGTSILVNGGSRYSHVFVVGLYTWTLEALLVVSTPGLPRDRQVRWGIVLGCAAALMLATRPADGALLGIGLATVFLYYSLARRRVGWRALVGATAGFGIWALAVLVILRLQLGKWWTTGYSLAPIYYPWMEPHYTLPQPNEWKYGLPLATGSFCWWPCSLPLGLAGLAMLQGRARGLAVALALGCMPYLAFVTYVDFGRGFDWGYGPRYAMVLLVPMAVGGGVALAPLSVAARRQALRRGTALARGGPLALAIFAVVSGWLRIVPLLWPPFFDHTRRHGGLERAVEEAHLKNAVVIAAPRTTGFSERDLETNFPVDLYPDQDVIIASDNATPQEAAACLRAEFPGRKLYSASGVDDVHIVPWGN
jgi:hypothetical protein